MGGIKLEITGLEQLAKELNVTVERVTEAAQAAVYGQGLALLELANRKGMVPVESGRLRASAFVTEPTVENGRTTCAVGYGTPYAAEVHERAYTTVSQGGHTRARSGTPGWLRRAVQIHANSLQLRLSESLRAALAKGFTVGQLAAAGVPTSPHDPGPGIGKYQRAHGFTKEQAAAMRGFKKSGAIHFVRRWKRPKKGR